MLTLVFRGILMFYIYTIITKMISREGDSIQKHVKTYHFKSPDNAAVIKDFIFMPSIEIKLSDKSDANVEVFKKLGLIESTESSN